MFYSNDPITESFLIKKYDDQRKKTLEYARAILELELKIKVIKDHIKEIKKDAKIDGVFVSGINKVLAEMKKVRKISDEEKAEFNELLNFFEDQPDIVALIERILNKQGE